jgi:hypothetical protein
MKYVPQMSSTLPENENEVIYRFSVAMPSCQWLA